MRELESGGGVLDAQKLLLCAGTAMQDVDIMFNLSRAIMSAAQELRCLQVRGAELGVVLTCSAA